MTGFLKLIGIWSVAAWFGAALLYNFGISPALRSETVQTLLGARHFPYFSGAIDIVAGGVYYGWLLALSFIALLHFAAERFYLGRSPRRFWIGLLLGLFSLVLLLALMVHPHLKESHLMRHAVNAPAQTREAADRSFRAYQRLGTGLNLLMIGGLAAYLWRVSTPAEPARFIPSGKFRANSGVDFIP